MTFRILGTYIRFTPTEWEIISDHLEGATDVVAEVSRLPRDVVESIKIHDRTKTKVVLYVPDGAEKALAACIWNGTYLARSRAEDPSTVFYRYRKAARSAAQKLNDAGIACVDMLTV